MAAFVLSVIVNEYPTGQVSAKVYCYEHTVEITRICEITEKGD